jgi:hypothetical protein
MKRLGIFSIFSIFSLFLAVSALAQTGGAVLVNGASSIEDNDCHFHLDLENARQILKGWAFSVFSSMGKVPSSVPTGHACDLQGFDLKDQ